MNAKNLVLLFLVVAFTSGCSKSPTEMLQDRSDLFEKRRAQATKIASALPDKVSLKDTALTLPANLDFTPGGNAMVIFEGQLADPCASQKILWTKGKIPAESDRLHINVGNTGSLRRHACYVKTGTWSGPKTLESLVAKSIAWMENLTHVVVFRVHRSISPNSVGKKPDEGTPKQFLQGGILGDVLLFELESGKFLDGAAVMATNTQTIEVRQKYTEIDLRLNLTKQFKLAIESLFSDLGAKAPR